MLKKSFSLLALVLGCMSINLSFAAGQELVVDLAASTGKISYGATGFLYGLSFDGIPTDNMLAPLKPQTIAQKAPDGLQHPDGDALLVAPQFKRVGGKHIMIYMQDVYAQWPYENLGLENYLGKIEQVMRKVMKDPQHDMYSYIPFNEPDGIWYNSPDKVQSFFADWKTAYEKIRSIDPQARIGGPACTKYDNEFFTQFMTFAQKNNVVPDITVWHELRGESHTGWNNHYNHYRNLEAQLGISPRPIIINEYGRISGELGVPGKLVQWISRFETSKVQGCIAYWTSAGTLNDLVTQNNNPTGGWWLYKWYGEMTGNTVVVTPPNPNIIGLQGLATLDTNKKQARVIFGGASGETDVVINGVNAAFGGESKLHAVVWGVDSTGTKPSQGAYIVHEGDYDVTNNQITIPVVAMKANSAYQIILTSALCLSTVKANRFEAEYADLSGAANVKNNHTGYSGTGFVGGYDTSDVVTKFIVNAEHNGYYNVTLGYSAGPLENIPAQRIARLRVNGSCLKEIELAGTDNWDTWGQKDIKVFLNTGINRITVNAVSGNPIAVDYLEVSPGKGAVDSYEAESPANTLKGDALVSNDPEKSGLKYVGFVGKGTNTLTFNKIKAAQAGTYRMIITYANAEMDKSSAGADYNTNPIHRYANISVNGAPAKKVYFRNTLNWTTYLTTEVDVKLEAGMNTILFNNSDGYAPNIDKIEIAAPYLN